MTGERPLVHVSPLGREMRVSTIITMIVLAAVAMFGPALVIFRMPLVPNWPYVGLVCLVASVVVGGVWRDDDNVG